jgi:hypothetical protein
VKGVRISLSPLPIVYPTVTLPPPPPAKPPLTDLQKQQNTALLQFRDSLSPKRWTEFKAYAVRYATELARIHAGEPGADVAAKEAVVNLHAILWHQVEAARAQREYLRLNPHHIYSVRGGAA